MNSLGYSAMRQSIELCLASASPRRKALLDGAGVAVSVSPVDIDETPNLGERPDDYVRRMANSKLLAAMGDLDLPPEQFVLASDTAVVLGNDILGKPRDGQEAREMLRGLSGKSHVVLTSWAVGRGQTVDRLAVDEAVVHFNVLDDETIENYIKTGEPMDKAGAYGIQGLGGALVSRYQGLFSTIVGLPLPPVLSALVDFGVLPHSTSQVELRLRTLKGRIAAASQAANRDPDSVCLIGASKSQKSDVLNLAAAAGLKDFGENYVQEWQEKRQSLPSDLHWHFIGHLQRNKSKLLVPYVKMIHGVDSPKTLRTLDHLGQLAGKAVAVCLQVNLGHEGTKKGVSPDALEGLIDAGRDLPGIDLAGLMAIPPKGDLSKTRAWFARLRRLRDRSADDRCPLPVLSMGMSSDFDGAIAEGATHVRIGSALFGPRP